MAASASPDPSLNGSSINTPAKATAVKDRYCPFCKQAFTSSSLGRHLDLYIREKNPKAPDGIHDVTKIREIRGNITRRQPRNSLAGEGESLTPDPQRVANRRESYSSRPDWDDYRRTPTKPLFTSRKAINAETGRALELALAEFIQAWKFASVAGKTKPLPFAFNPLELDYPALVLKCLKPSPTVATPTPSVTPNCWSLRPPGADEFACVQNYLHQKLSAWHEARLQQISRNAHPGVPVVDPEFEAIQKQREDIMHHLEDTYKNWQNLQPPQKHDVWFIEVARAFSRKRLENDELQEKIEVLKADKARLEAQLEAMLEHKHHLIDEYSLQSPSSLPWDPTVLHHLLHSKSLNLNERIGLTTEDLEKNDVPTLVSKVLDHWKYSAAVSARGSNAAKGVSGNVSASREGGGQQPMNLDEEEDVNPRGRKRPASGTETVTQKQKPKRSDYDTPTTTSHNTRESFRYPCNSFTSIPPPLINRMTGTTGGLSVHGDVDVYTSSTSRLNKSTNIRGEKEKGNRGRQTSFEVSSDADGDADGDEDDEDDGNDDKNDGDDDEDDDEEEDEEEDEEDAEMEDASSIRNTKPVVKRLGGKAQHHKNEKSLRDLKFTTSH